MPDRGLVRAATRHRPDENAARAIFVAAIALAHTLPATTADMRAMAIAAVARVFIARRSLFLRAGVSVCVAAKRLARKQIERSNGPYQVRRSTVQQSPNPAYTLNASRTHLPTCVAEDA